MYKSWLAALEKMAEKTNELSKQTNNPEAAKEFYDLWVKMYEKAFDGFFEDMPLDRSNERDDGACKDYG